MVVIIYDQARVWVEGESQKPPGRGVQVILQDHPDIGIELLTGKDYYVRLKSGLWLGVDFIGLIDYLLDNDSAHVLFGRMITQTEYNESVKLALDLKNIWGTPKAGWLPNERQIK